MKVKSLGTLAAASLSGILMTSGTNATPIVATVTAGHRQRNGNRIAIAGVTTLTAMNGEWSISSVGATAATLDGSAGNGAFAGTAAVTALCDRTPFLPGNSAAAIVGDTGGSALFAGTLVLEQADSITAADYFYTNTSGVATSGFKSSLLSGEIAMVAHGAVGGGTMMVEVKLGRYMKVRCSAYTSGVAFGALLA